MVKLYLHSSMLDKVYLYLSFTSGRIMAVFESLRRAADKSLVFPVSKFPICSTNQRIFLEYVKEVRTTKP
jgi:hypothetical protein